MFTATFNHVRMNGKTVTWAEFACKEAEIAEYIQKKMMDLGLEKALCTACQEDCFRPGVTRFSHR